MDPCNTVKIESKEKPWWKNHETHWPFPISSVVGHCHMCLMGVQSPFAVAF